jgi:hypothetical protein
MDIKDGVTTSSKEQLRSLVRVWELDEITPKGGKDRSVTKKHPRGLKRKRPNFMRKEPPSWTRGWHRQNGANGGGKVHKDMRTHGSEGATEPGPSRGRFTPISWAWRSFNPKYVEAPPFIERAIRPRGLHKLEREEEGDHSREGSLYSKEATTSKGGRWGPAKTPPEEKEDTIGSITMINGAKASTLMG